MLLIFVTNFIVEIKKSDAKNILETLKYMLGHTVGSWGSFSNCAYISVINSIVFRHLLDDSTSAVA